MEQKTRLHRIVLVVLALALVAQRWIVLDHFGFRYTDNDQVVMWYGATELSHLRLHEPRFYGQDYSTMLESAVAAPLVALRVPHAYALPLVTSLLALSPFLLLAWFARRRGLHVTSVASLALPLMLPLRFHLITSMPRGFVDGAFVASLAAVIGLQSEARLGAFLSGLLSGLSVSVLPSALLIAVPATLELLARKRRDARFLRFVAIGGLLAAGAHLAVQHYYVLHPPGEERLFDYEDPGRLRQQAGARLMLALAEPQRFLGDVLPTFGGGRAWTWSVVLVLPALLWLTRQKGAAVASTAGLAVLLLAFVSGRVHLGSASIFYSWSRPFLPLPLALLLYLLWCERGSGGRLPGTLRAGLAAVLVGGAGIASVGQLRGIDATVAREMAVPPDPIAPGRTDLITRECRRLAEDMSSTHTRLALFKSSDAVLLNYGCAAMFESITTLCPEHDRRGWLVRRELTSRPGSVLLVGYNERVEQRAIRKFTRVWRVRPGVMLAQVGERSLGEVTQLLKIPVRVPPG
jgi:hypothetical protein